MRTNPAVADVTLPVLAVLARAGQPEPPSTDDGNEWVDGSCWLWCRRAHGRVLFIGPATVSGVRVPMFACGPCIRER